MMIRWVRVCAVLTLAGAAWSTHAQAQRLCGVLNDQSCVQNYCGVMDGPGCEQNSQVAFSGNYQVTVGTKAAADVKKPDGALNTLTDLSRALSACWTPPASDDGFPGMQMTARFSLNRDGRLIGKPRMTFATAAASKRVRDLYLDAVGKSLEGCTPFQLSESFSQAIAGRPISIRVIDDRNLKRAELQRSN